VPEICVAFTIPFYHTLRKDGILMLKHVQVGTYYEEVYFMICFIVSELVHFISRKYGAYVEDSRV
jgi:hypothetical protein